MTKTILGIFSDRTDLERAIDRLKDDGFNPKDISIVMKDTQEAKDIGESTGVDVAQGAVSGATTGAVLGGLAGLLAATVIPGLGAFLIGGPIAAALGLTGTAAATASGAATGAVAGGLLGALMGWGLSEDEAKEYEASVKSGAILLAVPASETTDARVREILQECNAQNIKSVSTQEREDRIETRSSVRHFADDSNTQTQSTESYDQPIYATAKGGKSSTDDKGWHGEPERHAEAAKKGSSEESTKGGTSSSKGRGWHGDSEDHARAAKGEDVPGRGEGE